MCTGGHGGSSTEHRLSNQVETHPLLHENPLRDHFCHVSNCMDILLHSTGYSTNARHKHARCLVLTQHVDALEAGSLWFSRCKIYFAQAETQAVPPPLQPQFSRYAPFALPAMSRSALRTSALEADPQSLNPTMGICFLAGSECVPPDYKETRPGVRAKLLTASFRKLDFLAQTTVSHLARKFETSVTWVP